MSFATITEANPALSRRRVAVRRTRRQAVAATVIAAWLFCLATAISHTASDETIALDGITPLNPPAIYTSTLPPGVTGWDIGGTERSSPSWSPTLQAPVSTTAGDLAVVDARSFPDDVRISVALGNAGALARAYRYFMLPVRVRVHDGAAWSDRAADAGKQYLSLSNGFVSYTLPGGGIYEVAVPAGGSILAVSTSGDLSPTFIVTVD